jgi:putative oxidoreductase
LDQVDSFETLAGFEEVSYMALFGWLAVAGPGPISLDYLLQKLQPKASKQPFATPAKAV